MSIRPLDRDGRRWVIDYYPQGRKGRRVRLVFEGNEADALAYEMELRRSHVRAAPVSPRIMDAVPDWLNFYEVNRSPATFRDVKSAFKKINPFFGRLKFNNLTPALIEQYKARRIGEGVCRRTVNKELSYFSSLVGWAVENGYANPLPFRIKKFRKTPPPMPDIPTPEEVEKLIKKAEARYRPIFILLYDTGLRVSEALNLEVKNVYLKRGFFLIRGKGNKERLVPITTARLERALKKACRGKKAGYAFINPRTGRPWHSIRKALKRAAKKAGIKRRVYAHLLRHSFGTHALDAGVNLRALQGILGHSTSKVTERYAHLLGTYLSREGHKFDDYIGQVKRRKTSEKKKKSKVQN